jgi:two-component system, NarL family, nitrate/nitrite response regulator NarL
LSTTRKLYGVVSGLFLPGTLWEFAEAENGKQAFEKVRELKLELVILNVNMPVTNGVEAAREIRRFAPRTKIVLFSVHDSPLIIETAKKSRVDAYVLKSAAVKDLNVTIKRLLQPVGHFGTGRPGTN